MNFKNFFSTPAKKVLSATGFMALGIAFFYGFYGMEQKPPEFTKVGELSADLLNALPPESIKQLPVLSPESVKVWLSAGQGVTTDAQGNVTKWEDLSGNGNDVVADSNHAPKLVQESQKGVFNFQPVLSFDGENDFIRSLSNSGYGDQFFIVFRADNNISSTSPVNGQPILQFDDPELENEKEISGLSVGNIVPDNEDYPTGEVLTFATGNYRAGTFSENYSYPTIPMVVQVQNSENLGTQMYINGSNDVINGTSQEQPFHFIKGTPFILGANAGKTLFFKGEIAEVIILEEKISDEEAQSVQEYLGTKYGVSMGLQQNYSLDFGENILFNVKQNPSYSQGIFGIGRYDSMGLNIGSSQSPQRFSQNTQLKQRVIGLGQASDLSNGDFVYVAHNSGDEKWSNQITPEGAQLLNRKWRIEESSINLSDNEAEADEGVGSVVLTLRTGDQFNIPTPAANTSYAFAFFTEDDFNAPPKEYVFINDEEKEGDAMAEDGIYSGTLADLSEVHYFTLAQFGPSPSGIDIDSIQQSAQDNKKVEIKTKITDLNKEENIELQVQFESDADGQCNGPWNYATLSNPLTSLQGEAVLLSLEKQVQNQGFQVENIQTLSGENQVNFTWEAGVDLPQAFDTPGESTNHCLKFLVRDPSTEGETLTKNINLVNGPVQEEALAAINIAVSGPQDLTEAKVTLSNNLGEAVLKNGENKDFVVPANGNYTVTCQTPQGYTLTTNPHPIAVNAIAAQSTQKVTCSYQQQEAPKLSEAKLTVKVTGLKENGVAKVNISNSIAKDLEISNDSQVNFTIEAKKKYEVNCEENPKDHFLLNVDNPTVIEEGKLLEGAQAIVTCEYAEGSADEGTVEYEEGLTQKILESETACLMYNPEIRDLKFSDINDVNAIGAKEAIILSKTFLLGGTPSAELKELQAQAQFPLSGAGSTIGDTGQTEAQVHLTDTVTRADALKFIMNIFCIPILDSSSLANKTERKDGQVMPVYEDAPRKGLVADHIITTASFLGLVEGRNYQGKFDAKLPNRIDWNAPVSKSELIKIVINAKQLWQGYQDQPNFDLAKEYGFNNNQWFYPFYARAFKENSESPLLEVPTVIQEPESSATRGMMIAYVFKTLMDAGLYKDPAGVQAAMQEF